MALILADRQTEMIKLAVTLYNHFADTLKKKKVYKIQNSRRVTVHSLYFILTFVTAGRMYLKI
jgi:hypothetical protein